MTLNDEKITKFLPSSEKSEALPTRHVYYIIGMCTHVKFIVNY